MNKIRNNRLLKLGCKIVTIIAAIAFASCAFADPTVGSIASNITDSFSSIGKLMFAVSFIAGFGFVIAGIFKFKQHKDNPTQIPMGTPIAMVVIGIALIFLPSLIMPVGSTMFKGTTTHAGGWKGGGITSVFKSAGQ